MKKLVSILLAVAMMLSTITVQAETADVVIKAGTVTAGAGSVVEVPIIIEKNTGFAGLNMYFTYPGLLGFDSLTNSVNELTFTNDATCVWDGASNYTGTGNLAILKLIIPANAEAGAEYSVKLNFIEAFDINLNEVSVSVLDGSIKVACPYGEADGNHKDANGQWESDEEYHFRTCGCGMMFNYAPHSGGSATCTEKAKCSTCGKEYGTVNTHTYTAQTVKATALVTAGNCRDEAVYYYSCANCGSVERNANHTFKGAKVATNHVGGTTTVNKAEANHITQTNGYTGDTQCLGCNQIIAYGRPIPADTHTPEATWSNDGTHHWKKCAVLGCDVVISGTKSTHCSNKAENKATCQRAAVCDVCGVSYGDVASHNWATTYSKEATGHWYDCQTSGCDEKKDFATHTPDHQGSATEDYAIKCTVCQYEIESQLAHSHVYDKEVVKEVYKASNATCDDSATYYKSCKCGAFQSNETFSYGDPAGHRWANPTCTAPKTCYACGDTEGEALGHTEGNEWVKDYLNHWHICTVSGCGAVIESSKAAHTPDREEPTETDDVKCTECELVLATLNPPHYHAHGKEWKYNQYEHWNECSCSNRAFIAYHEDTNKDGLCDTCGYGVPVVGTTTIPTSPKTGDNSVKWIWTTLAGFFALASAVTNVYGKKKQLF